MLVLQLSGEFGPYDYGALIRLVLSVGVALLVVHFHLIYPVVNTFPSVVVSVKFRFGCEPFFNLPRQGSNQC